MKTHISWVGLFLIPLYLSGCGQALNCVTQVKSDQLGCIAKTIRNDGSDKGNGKGEPGPSDLETYIKRFEDRSNDSGRPTSTSGITVHFADLSGSVVGLCQRSSSTTSSSGDVSIDQRFWNKSDETTKEMLIDHELGHCALRRGHNSSMNGNKPTSLMYPQIFASRTFSDNYWDYIHELFGGASAHDGNSEVPIPYPDAGPDDFSPDGNYACPEELFVAPR